MARRRSRGSRVSRKRSKVSRKRSRVLRKRSRVSRNKRGGSLYEHGEGDGAVLRLPPIASAEPRPTEELLEAQERQQREEKNAMITSLIESFNRELIKWWGEVNTAISQYNGNITQIEELKTNIEIKLKEHERLEADFQRWESSVKDEEEFLYFLDKKEKTFKEFKKDIVSVVTVQVYPPSHFHNTNLKKMQRYAKFNKKHNELLSQIKKNVDQKDVIINKVLVRQRRGRPNVYEEEVLGIWYPFHDHWNIVEVKLKVPVDVVLEDERFFNKVGDAVVEDIGRRLKGIVHQDMEMYGDTINMRDTLEGLIDGSLSTTQGENEMFNAMFDTCKDYLVRGDFNLLEAKFKEYQITFPDYHPKKYIFSLILRQILGRVRRKKWFGREYNSLSKMTQAIEDRTGVFETGSAHSEFQRSCEILNLLNVDGVSTEFPEVDIDLSNFEVDKPPAEEEARGAALSASPAARSDKPGVGRLLGLAKTPPPVAAPAVAAVEEEGEEGEAPPPNWSEGTILKQREPDEGSEDIRVIFQNFKEPDYWSAPGPPNFWFSGLYVKREGEGLYDLQTKDYEEAEDEDEGEGEEGAAAAPPPPIAAPPVATVEGAEEEGEGEGEGEGEDAEDASSRTRFGMMGRRDEIEEREWRERKAAAEEAERLEKIAAANAAGKQRKQVTTYTSRGTKETTPAWKPPPNAFKKRN